MKQSQIPYSSDAERGVLACMLVSEQARATALSTLQAEEFYVPANRAIFKVFASLYEKGKAVDPVILGDALKDAGDYDMAGGFKYIGNLIDPLINGDNVEEYCDIVHEKAVARNLIDASKKIIDEALSGERDSVQELLDNAEGMIFSVSTDLRRAGYMNMQSLMELASTTLDYRRNSDETIFGIKSGINKLDLKLGGFKDSTLNIIAARPAMGKTSLALNILENAAVSHGTKCMLFSLEMSRQELSDRLIASQARVNLQKILRGDWSEAEAERLRSAVSVLQDAQIVIDDQAFTTPLEVRAKARRVMKEQGLDLLVVDYLQLMSGDKGGNREQEISSISRFFKGLAKELDIPVILLSQLSRACEQREDKRPILSDLRESGAIEQDADTVTFVFREEIYTGPITKDGRDVEDQAELLISKHRNGPTGFIRLRFNKEYTKFEES